MGTKTAQRPVQTQCVTDLGTKTCNHPRTLHGKDAGRCRALGCKCTGWTEPDE